MLQRGFKTWCENIAASYRKELKIKIEDQLLPRSLALQMGVKVVDPSSIPGVPKNSIRQLTQIDPSSWSAITLNRNGKTVVIVNSAHAPVRENSNIVHELSHIILGHEAVEVHSDTDGYLMVSHFDKTQEYEADWLAGVLLVPRDGLLAFRRRGISHEETAKHYGVSKEMYQWRLRMTGVERQLSRGVLKRSRS